MTFIELQSSYGTTTNNTLSRDEKAILFILNAEIDYYNWLYFANQH
jgi:hypothetical protein